VDALPKRFICLLSLCCAFRLSAAPQTVRIDAPGIPMRIDERMYTELEGLAPMSASETVTLQGREVMDFQLRDHKSRRVTDKLGSGWQHIMTGQAEHLRKELTVTSYSDFPGILVI